MKTKLNLICLLVFAFMIADLSGGWFEWNIGKNAANYEEDIRRQGKSDLSEHEVVDARLVQLLPISEKQTAISVKNEVTGKTVNAWPKMVYVEADEYESPGRDTLFTLVCLVSFICALYAFVRFIVRVNKNHFFDTTNVKLLRIAGTGLVLYGGLASLWSTIDQIHNAKLFRMEGYSVDWLSGFEFTPFMLGLIAFVAAQVFAMAVKMKEEQDLTI